MQTYLDVFDDNMKKKGPYLFKKEKGFTNKKLERSHS